VKTVLGILGRYVLVWLVNVLALLLATSLLPGFSFDTDNPHWWKVALTLPIQLAILVILLRPLMLLLTLPLNSLTLGLPTLFFNGIVLYLAARVNPSFAVTDPLQVLIGALIITSVSTSVVGWLGLDEAYPFFQMLIYRVGQRLGPKPSPDVRRGLLLLQIDGLSHGSLLTTLERGRMPTISAMLAKRSYRLWRWQCGIPSNTPAVQAGFMYGTREDVAGYRWYDRAAGKVRVVSNPDDLRALERRVAAEGDPLLVGGSCINTFLSGGADKRLLTVSALREPPGQQRPGERVDFNLLFLSPYTYPRAVLASVWDYLAGLVFSVAARLSSDRPRLKFSFRRQAQRAVANGFLRETSFFWIKQDMVRGVPVIYSNFVGYDDVAHYSGPDTHEAQISLAAFDRILHRLRRLARKGAAMDYDIVLLSDHGQTPSVPFRILYGQTIEELIADFVGQAVVSGEIADPDASYVATLLVALEETETGRRGWSGMRGRRALARISSAAVAEDPSAPQIVVCVSGSLAHIYFGGRQEPLHLEAIMEEYPGLVERLTDHPGIGFVAAARGYGDAVAIGRQGVRNLITGVVVGGGDPLTPYGDAERWSGELAQLLGYPSSGDLIVNGSWLPEQQKVVVLEEQSSSHGGIGGRQTEPFLITPAWWGTEPENLDSPEALHRHLQAMLRYYRPDPTRETAAPDPPSLGDAG